MSEDGLIHAAWFDGKGGGHKLGWDTLASESPVGGFQWVQLDYTRERAQDWIIHSSGLHSADVDALLKEDTRPRCVIGRQGVLVVLRSVNLNPGADPDDMVAVRVWADPNRIIATRNRRPTWEQDILEALDHREAPATTGEFLVMMAESIVDRISEVVQDVEEQVAEIEETVLERQDTALRSQLSDVRRQIINLRRYLAPQREALARLRSDKITWLTDADNLYLREVQDKMGRSVEDLDAAQDRAAVANEELVNHTTAELNQRIYLLSVIAGLFMPLTFLTGLLGINVGGIPLAQDARGFLIVCMTLGVIGLVLYLLFRRRKWM